MWEYRIISATNVGAHIDVTERQLNSLGANGWEAYAVAVQFTNHVIYLKRRKEEGK